MIKSMKKNQPEAALALVVLLGIILFSFSIPFRNGLQEFASSPFNLVNKIFTIVINSIESNNNLALVTPVISTSESRTIDQESASKRNTVINSYVYPSEFVNANSNGNLGLGSAILITDDVNVRSAPEITDTNKLEVQILGSLGTIIGGPIYASGHTWWNVNFLNDPDGWVSNAYIK